MPEKDIFSEQLGRLLLSQAGLIGKDEELKDDPSTPASARDILRCKKYWKEMPERFKKYEKQDGISNA